MTTFRQVIPSARLSGYYLAWLSTGGGIRPWYFSTTESDDTDKYDSIIIESTDNIRSVPSTERKTIDVITKSLNAEDYEYVKSILASNRVYLIDSDWNKTPIAILSGEASKPNKSKEHSVRVKFIFKEADTLNV